MEPTFKLSVTGIRPHQNLQIVQDQLKAVLKGDPAKIQAAIQRILKNQPVVLAEDLSSDRAENLLDMFTEDGLICRLDPMQLSLAPLEEDAPPYRCPACGHKQPAAPNGADICERCSVAGRNYPSYREFKEILELERRRLGTQNAYNEAQEAEEADRKRQKALRIRARRQAERERGITARDKLKALLRPQALLPVAGLAAVTGMGLLIWQMQTSQPSQPPNASTKRTSALQTPVAPTPSTAVTPASPSNNVSTAAIPNVVGVAAAAKSADSVVHPNVLAVSEVAVPSTTLPSGNSVAPAAPDDNAHTPDPAVKQVSTPRTTETVAQPTVPLNQATPVGSNLLIVFDKTTSASIAYPTADQPVAAPSGVGNNLQLLTGIARYQAETGDLAAAERSLQRAGEQLSANRNGQPADVLDAFNRSQVEILAIIAGRQHKHGEVVAAQAKWYRAMNLANVIVAPGERVQAFTAVAASLQSVNAATAKSYFDRAIDGARTINDPALRGIALSAVARDLVGAGRSKQAEEIFTQAMVAATAIADVHSRLATLGVIAKHNAEAGDIIAARKLLSRIAEDLGRTTPPPEFIRRHADVQSAIARNLAMSNDIPGARTEFAAALNRIATLSDQDDRADVMIYLARNLAAAGDLESATRIVNDVLQRRDRP